MSAGAAVEALTLTLGAFHLHKLDFAVARGEILVILGPNGSGKSVTLETIAGFHRPTSGRVVIGGRDVTALRPDRRNIGFVVQNFGLFPHLTVAQNVAIARRRDRTAAAHDQALPPLGDDAALLAYFGVAHLAKRGPSDLSPGEKQRVALARALAGAPDLFLFDEPFSALDAETHQQLRDELKEFLRALSIPAIFVTHDRSDAYALADVIAVLRDGAIVQTGMAAEIFQKPTNTFVARFVGVENVLSGSIAETAQNGISIEVGTQVLRAAAPAKALPAGSAVFVGIRAEDVAICLPDAGGPPTSTVNRLKGRITRLRSEGALIMVSLDCSFPLKSCLLRPQARALSLEVGNMVAVAIPPDAIQLMVK
jgi:ABC-type Fe3+/spermidine/putrescine transport system ATPase subunit